MKIFSAVLLKFSIISLLFLYSGMAFSQKDKIEELDILILGGRVIDGSGNPWMVQDIGVVGDKIVFVGNADGLKRRAKLTIDAEGLYVTPGFIDMHSHADLIHPQGKKMLPQIYQGVTSVIVGVDGSGKNNT